MSSIKNDQRGIAMIIEVLAATIVLAGIGFAGYRIMKARGKTVTLPTYVSTTKKESKTEPSWQKGDIAVKGTYADSSVVKVSDGKWRMYYGIQPEVKGNNLEVYSSTSADGKTWVQDAGMRKKMATFPNVIKLADGKYRMYFQNGAVIKSAVSTDGLSFTDEAGTRVDKTNSEGMTLDNVAAPSVFIKDDGSYLMVYRATSNVRYAADTPNASTQVLFWATSADGLAWTKKGTAVDSRNKTLNGQLDGPDIVKWDDGKIRVFATTYTGVYQFDFDGTKFSEGSLAYTTSSQLSASNKPTNPSAPTTPAGATAPTGPATGTGPTPSTTPASPPSGGTPAQPPGDPSVIKINGTWFMYYGQTTEAGNGLHFATYK